MLHLFTSIRPPADAEAVTYLRDCLNSWRAAGFGVVAVNGPAEADALRKLDLPVELSVMATDGKPRIGAFLSAIRGGSSRLAGIINSDCRIAGCPGLAANLQKQLEGRALLAWRLDVGDLKPSAVRYGFDAFFSIPRSCRQTMPAFPSVIPGGTTGSRWLAKCVAGASRRLLSRY